MTKFDLLGDAVDVGDCGLDDPTVVSLTVCRNDGFELDDRGDAVFLATTPATTSTPSTPLTISIKVRPDDHGSVIKLMSNFGKVLICIMAKKALRASPPLGSLSVCLSIGMAADHRRGAAMSAHSRALVTALGLFILWTLSTWLLEGRLETLLRPDAIADRLIYALVANLVIGIVGGALVLWITFRWGVSNRKASGFGSSTRTIVAVVAGLSLGLLFYYLLGGASTNPVVIANAFSQVLVVSAAEILVCWAVVGSVVEASLAHRGRYTAIIGGALAASLLFGVYHFAHSPPFNTFAMVGFLSLIGLVTSLFFFVVRDVYGTIAFHNFLGVLGVVNALAAQDQLETFTRPQFPLFITAIVSVAALVAIDHFMLRRNAAMASASA